MKNYVYGKKYCAERAIITKKIIELEDQGNKDKRIIQMNSKNIILLCNGCIDNKYLVVCGNILRNRGWKWSKEGSFNSDGKRGYYYEYIPKEVINGLWK